MGRSVSRPSDATVVAYDSHNDMDDEDGLPNPFWYEVMIEDSYYRICGLYPSMTRCDKWLGHEDRAIACNDHAYFGFSEYCGLIAYWLVPRSEFGAAWVARVERTFSREFATLRLDGYMSNGCGVYYRIEQASA